MERAAVPPESTAKKADDLSILAPKNDSNLPSSEQPTVSPVSVKDDGLGHPSAEPVVSDRPAVPASSVASPEQGTDQNHNITASTEVPPDAHEPTPAVPSQPTQIEFSKIPQHNETESSEHTSLPAKLGEIGARLDEAARKRELLIAFAFIFVPMSVIAFVLIAFVYYEKDRVHFNREGNGTPELPAFPIPPANAYYTTIGIGGFLLVSSWASTAAGVIFAPFMLLFSFVVARQLTRQYSQNPPPTKHDQYLLREILSGSWQGVLHWVEHAARRMLGREKKAKNSSIERRATHIAALGLCGTGILSLLVIIGDNWLHLYTQRLSLRYFDDSTYPATNASATSAVDDPYAAGWTTIDNCQTQLTTVLPQNRSAGVLPCSLNDTDGLLNVAFAPYTYLTLDTGISQVTSGFNTINFTQQDKGEIEGSATNEQVVTHVDSVTGLSHSMLFYPDASYEYQADDDQNNYGIDYVANTTSAVTQCAFATQQCQLTAQAPPTGSLSRVLYNCSSIFVGDLNQTPINGLERASGWNMSFYELVNGSPSSIPYQAQANPFLFYAAAAVDSISLADYEMLTNTAAIGQVIDAGQGRIAFALSCNTTVYDVQYAMINGSIAGFNATLSDPRKANIVQAPIQIGFGQYRLFQAASAAAVATGIPILDSMSLAFSQIGMAAASAAFVYDKNIAQRFRWDIAVTQVPFAPFWFLVVSCLLYSVCGIAILVAAFWLRKDEPTRRRQSELLPNPTFEDDWERLKHLFEHPIDTLKEHWSEILFGLARKRIDPEGDDAAGLDIIEKPEDDLV